MAPKYLTILKINNIFIIYFYSFQWYLMNFLEDLSWRNIRLSAKDKKCSILFWNKHSILLKLRAILVSKIVLQEQPSKVSLNIFKSKVLFPTCDRMNERATRIEKTIKCVRDNLAEESRTSTRRRSRELGVSCRSLQRILKELYLLPYEILWSKN